MKMARSTLVLALASATLLAGCQTKTLSIKPFGSGGEGAPYALRFTQYDVAIKWRVTSCGRRTARPGEQFNQVPVQPFTVVADVLAEPTYPEDPERRWLLDLSSLDGWINATDMTITYEGGRFKSFNAVVEDKTVDTVTAVAGAMSKLAALGMPVAGGAPDPCADLVETSRVAKEKVEADTRSLASARTELATAQASGTSKSSIERLEAKLRLSADNLATSAAALEKALKAVTYEQKLKWPKRGSGGPDEKLPIPSEAIIQWQATSFPDVGKIAVLLDLRVLDAAGELKPAARENVADLESKIASGRLPVRVARPGALVASLVTPVLSAPDKVEEIGRKESAVIQSGDLIYIPVTYQWPRSSTASFAVDANGYLASVGHKQSNAPAQVIAKFIDTLAEQTDKIVKTDLENLKEENELLTARESNAKLQASLNPKPSSPEKLQLEAIQSELTLKKAKLELALVERWLTILGN